MEKTKQKQMPIFYLYANVSRSIQESDYAKLQSCVEAWMKATSEDKALELVTDRLLAEGWRITKRHGMVRGFPCLATIGAMLDPPIFSEEEADEWLEQYQVAEAEGFSCIFKHYPKMLESQA